jgi:hypothetical protein
MKFVVNLQEKDDLGTYWSMSCEYIQHKVNTMKKSCQIMQLDYLVLV